MKKMKVFAFLFVFVGILASCSNDEVDNATPKGEQVISLKLEQPKLSTRALETPIADQAAIEFETVTLYFWKDGNKGTPAANPTKVLSTADIAIATDPDGDGLKISVGTDVTHVSMTANTTVAGGEGVDYAIKNLQGLGTNFTKKVPMVSPAVAPTTHQTVTNAQLVTLKPTPELARIEVMGKITPPVNTRADKSAYKSVTIEEVYINNYRTNKVAEGLTAIKAPSAGGDWANYEDSMHDKNVAAEIAEKTKAAAYQVFPAKNDGADDDLIPHIILKVKYVKNDEADTEVENRWITISKYKTGGAEMKNFEAGKIYKLDLASLNDLFATGDNGELLDPTDPEPETPKTDLYVKITSYKWEAVNITPGL